MAEEELREFIRAELDRFRGDEPVYDDRSLVVIKREDS